MSDKMLSFRFIIVVILIGMIFAQEAQRFHTCMENERKNCVTSCQSSCDRDSEGYLDPFSEYKKGTIGRLWDEISVSLLGYKRIKGILHTPCLERCMQNSHVLCTRMNYEQGGLETFSFGGRMPIQRFYFIEEIFSSLFSLGCGIYMSFSLWRYIRIAWHNQGKDFGIQKDLSYHARPISLTKAETSAAYSRIQFPFKLQTATWMFLSMITFYSAFLFHVKDTLLTERMDYYSAFVALLFELWLTLIRVFWVTDRNTRMIIGAPIGFYVLYHLYYMQFVSFDYGYNMKVLVVSLFTESVIWIIWVLRSNNPNRWRAFTLRVGIILLSSFEMFEFAPLFGYIDTHAIWHGCMWFLHVVAVSFYNHDVVYFQQADKLL